MVKNYSPKKTAIIAGTFTFVLVFITSFIVFGEAAYSGIVAFIMFVTVYAIVLYYITNILDKKINTIYKFINQTKAGKREEFYNKSLLPRPSLDVLFADVEAWASTNTEAFALFEKNEQYRKEFLQNLSHELKTPLFAIQGYVESLQNGALHDENVNVKFLQNTANNVQRLTDLIKDLDEITKLESGTNELDIKPQLIDEMLEQMCTDFAHLALQKNITLEIKQESLKNRKVLADKNKIIQVLVNLTENAIKYSKQNGKVTFNVIDLNSTTLIVEINDDGIGIADSQIERIFERFYRTDEARTRQIGGSGLGLAICKHIIEAHKQTIHVSSKINVGTTFRFTMQKA
jgi:two-component system, OmpR family, phosphate regulon sensor histidine kinase PhoR